MAVSPKQYRDSAKRWIKRIDAAILEGNVTEFWAPKHPKRICGQVVIDLTGHIPKRVHEQIAKAYVRLGWVAVEFALSSDPATEVKLIPKKEKG